MRNGYPTLPLSLTPARSLAGALLLALAGACLALEAEAAPGISRLRPTSGPVGTSVVMTGANFGESQGSSRVSFNGTEASPTSWSGTRIEVPVPEGAGTGAVVVTVGGVASNGMPFTVGDNVQPMRLLCRSSISEPSGHSDIIAHLGTGNEPAEDVPVGIALTGTATPEADYTVGTLTIPAGRAFGLMSPRLAVVDDAVYEGEETIELTLTAEGYEMVICTITLEDDELPPAPEIAALNPATGAVGTSIEITGANFGESQGLSRVEFNGTEASPTSWSGTRITAPVPEGAGTGAVVVTVEGQASNGVVFTVPVPAPEIAALNPATGAVGTSIEITGANFGESQGLSRVEFNGTEASPTSWSGTRIEVPVPEGARTGAVVVTVEGQASNGVVFTVPVPAPEIASLNPATGAVGTSIEITGANFGESQGLSRVEFNGTEAAPTSWSGTRIEVPVPEGARTGAVVVTVEGQASNGVVFTVTVPAPEIAALNPATGAVGTSIEITGANFGESQGASRVSFNGTEAAPTSWSGTRIEVPVPEGAGTGAVVVTVEGQVSNGEVFTVPVPAPEIASLNPVSGAVGTPVEITGANFGESQGASRVSFNGTEAAPTSWSGTRIEVPVPEGAGTGAVVVTVGGVASNGVGFTVPAPVPGISRLRPTSGPVGTSVVMTGANFGESQGSSRVSFNGTEAAPTSWSGTRIEVPVPEGAGTGAVVVTVGGVASNGMPFTVGDNVQPMRLLCRSSISEPSGHSDIIAHLGTGNEPAEDVPLGIALTGTATPEADYTVGTLTIPAGRAFGLMSPRLAVVDDAVYEGEETIELTLTAEGYETATCTITLEDDEAVPVPSITALSRVSGAVGTSVEITGANFGESQGASTVTFNGPAASPTSWSETRIEVLVPEGARTGAVVVTVGGVGSNGVPFTVTGVRVTPTELTIKEGEEGSYTVVLDSKPASAVTVSMFAPDGTDLSVDILPVFTASNWDEPQTVTVTAGEDADQEDDIDTIVHRTASADASYHDLTVDSVEVRVTDNDAGAGVRVTPRELTVEEGEEGTYTVVLNAEPAAAVAVSVTAGGDLTVSPTSLAFTTENWDTPQEVTVTVAEDEDAEDETETVTHAVTSADTGYSGLAVDGVRVTIADDEGTGGPGGTEELTVSTTRLRITEGNMGSYTVVLNRAPTSGVTVAVSVPSGGDLTVSPTSLAFTTENWDTPQEVMVTAGQDADLADEVESITHTITRGTTGASSSLRGGVAPHAAFATAMGSPSPTREYVYLGDRLVAIAQGGTVSEASVVVTIDDDDDPDTPGVPALTNSLRLSEGHTGAYTLELGAEPTAPVTIALSVSRGSDNVADVTVSPTSLAFTTGNWDIPQWVTVSVGEDSDTVGETETISHAATSADSRYQGIKIPPVKVVIRDRNRTTTPEPDPPEGRLMADPNPCLIPAGQDRCSTTLSWTSEHVDAVQLRRGPSEVLVRSGGLVGSRQVGNILETPTVEFPSTFYLYEYVTSSSRRGQELDRITVTGVPAPTISPNSGPVGTMVTITGSGFGSPGPGDRAQWLTLNGARVSYRSWSNTEIVFEVPWGGDQRPGGEKHIQRRNQRARGISPSRSWLGRTFAV